MSKILTAAHATCYLHQPSLTYVPLLLSTSLLKLLAAQGIYIETPMSAEYTCPLMYRVLLSDPCCPDVVLTKQLSGHCTPSAFAAGTRLASPLRSRQVERLNAYTLRRRRSSLWCSADPPSTTGVRIEAIYTHAFRNHQTDDLRDETFAWTPLQTAPFADRMFESFWKASAPKHEN